VTTEAKQIIIDCLVDTPDF